MSDSITITVEADIGGKAAETWTMSTGDMAAFQAFVKASYPHPIEGVEREADEDVAAWAKATLQGTMDNVTRYLKLKAATDAASGVPPVGGTVT